MLINKCKPLINKTLKFTHPCLLFTRCGADAINAGQCTRVMHILSSVLIAVLGATHCA